MIIKLLLITMSIILLILVISTIRLIYWNRLLRRRQSQPRLNTTWWTRATIIRLSMITVLLFSVITIRINATGVYLKLTGGVQKDARCAYDLNKIEDLVDYNPDVFIGEIESLERVKKYNVLNDRHEYFVDYYFYHFTSIQKINGASKEARVILRSVAVNHPNVRLSSCSEKTKLKVGKVYLIISNYSSPEEAKGFTDPRAQEGDYFRVPKAILLDGYDKTKGLHEQSEEIREIVNEYIAYFEGNKG